MQLKSQWNTLYHIPLALRFVLQKITMHNTVLRCHTQRAKTPSYTDKYEYKKEGLCFCVHTNDIRLFGNKQTYLDACQR